MKNNETDKDGVVWRKTPSGMDCYFIPMPNYGEKMAAIVVKAGSNFLLSDGSDGKGPQTFPEGTAHFIEHRLFRQSWGDAFAAFSKQGASANAFTDPLKTVYYFSCHENFFENLRLLLSFVQNPYFLKEETEQEKSIIDSEITMYDDDPDWVVYYQLLQAMYHNHPVRIPIAGDHKSIKEINYKVLRQAYDCLYTPDRFSLICGGDIPIRKVMESVGMMKKEKVGSKPLFDREPSEVKESYIERKLGITRPIFQIGIKMTPIAENRFEQRMVMGILMDALVGESSLFYKEAYEKKYLNEPMGVAYFSGEEYAFCAFSGVGERGQEVCNLFMDHLERMRRNGIAKEEFYRIRKKQIGAFIRRSQSVSGMVLGQVEWAMEDITANQAFRLIKSVEKSQVDWLLQNDLLSERIVLSIVR